MAKTATADPGEKIVQLRNGGAKWGDIAEEVNLPTGKCMFLYDVATTTPKERIKNATAADIVRLRDTDLISWGKISARTGIPESRCRTMYTEATGQETLGNRIGKGGRFPGQNSDVNGERPARRAPKAAKETAPSASVVALQEAGDDLDKVKELIELRAVKLTDGSVIKIRSVKAVKNGAIQVVNDETSKARVLKLANITGVSKAKVVKLAK